MTKVPPVLYDENGNPEYFSMAKMTEVLRLVHDLFEERLALYNKDTIILDLNQTKVYASHILNNIIRIKSSIPPEIRDNPSLSNLGLSDKELGELEKRCKGMVAIK